MTTGDLIMIWADNRALSIFIWLVLIISALYFARPAAHGVILSITRALRNSARLATRSLHTLEQRVAQRNRAVLLGDGRDVSERSIDREFQRVSTIVGRDLAGFPALERELRQQIASIEKDYRDAVEIPPMPPAWHNAVEAVARIPPNGDPTYARVLTDVNKAFKKAADRALDESRRSATDRHTILLRMMPFWRGVDRSLERVEKKIESLEERSHTIDKQFETYQEIVARTDRAERLLSTSSVTQFFISGAVLLIAMLGAFINFQLIALPMSEMVGGNSYLYFSQSFALKTADVAALVIISVELAMGLFFMEALGITRLFPVIRGMDDKLRHRMLWITLGILFTLACVESALAYMRDLLAADRAALTQQLSGLEVATPAFRWIPSVGQMVMGFILPFALVFVAIPLESFIHSSRSVLGASYAAFLRFLIFLARVWGNLMTQVGSVLTHAYDAIIFIPLRIEQLLRERLERQYARAEYIPSVEPLPDSANDQLHPVMESQRGDVEYHFEVAKEPKK
jgi:hypothetical protein